MKKMPVLFVGHGSPMNVLDKENPFNQNFSLITQKFAKPNAILMISAHWYSSRLQVTSGKHPEIIYDFYGFPDELSQVQGQHRLPHKHRLGGNFHLGFRGNLA